jgi:hypothetical protein
LADVRPKLWAVTFLMQDLTVAFPELGRKSLTMYVRSTGEKGSDKYPAKSIADWEERQKAPRLRHFALSLPALPQAEGTGASTYLVPRSANLGTQ